MTGLSKFRTGVIARREPVVTGDVLPAVRPSAQLARPTGGQVVMAARPVPTPNLGGRGRLNTAPAQLALAVTVALASLAGAGFAAAYLVSISMPPLPVVLGALAVPAGVLFLLGKAGACPGLHCFGCRHQ